MLLLKSLILSLYLNAGHCFAFVGSNIKFEQLQSTGAGYESSRCRRISDSNTAMMMCSDSVNEIERREMFHLVAQVASVALGSASVLVASGTHPALASSFTAGGTLVDREVGIQVGNPEASPSRNVDNSNVIFDKDYYFKFGAGAQWIEPGNTEFPKTVPFAPSQQRYDSLKKYGERVKSAVKVVDGLKDIITSSGGGSIPDPNTAPEYNLKAMGLLANNFLASENTGTTNELFLARWYINELYLHLGDIRKSTNEEDALKSYSSAKKALNSYLGLLNRVVTAKVGDKFELLSM